MGNGFLGWMMCCGSTTIDFVIELKTFPADPGRSASGAEIAEAVVAVADAAHATTRITVEGFDWRGPRHLHRIRPDVRLAWLTRAETVRDAAVWWGGPHPGDFGGSVPRAVAAEGGPVWAPAHVDLTQDLVDEAHALGLAVIPWTVNDVADMMRLVRWGVDGIVYGPSRPGDAGGAGTRNLSRPAGEVDAERRG